MSIYPDSVYRRVRRLEAWSDSQPNAVADLLRTLMQAQAATRRLLLPKHDKGDDKGVRYICLPLACAG